MASIKELKAFNFQKWIEDNKDKFKPPVGNAQVWEDGEMMVTVVGGPNQRHDYHDDPTEEFFYQLKGNVFLRLMETPGKPPIEVPLREGDIFLSAQAHAAFTATRCWKHWCCGRDAASRRRYRRFRMVLSDLSSTAASRGSEAEKHSSRPSATFRPVLQQPDFA